MVKRAVVLNKGRSNPFQKYEKNKVKTMYMMKNIGRTHSEAVL